MHHDLPQTHQNATRSSFAMRQSFYSVPANWEWSVALRSGGLVEQPPGGLLISPYTVYLITQENCANCPAAKAVVQEALSDTDVPVKIINLDDMDPDLEFRLLENQLFVASTPSIIIERGGTLKMIHSGEVPSIEQVRSAAGVS